MANKKMAYAEFDYYRLSLLDYLRSSFPEYLKDEDFIQDRSEAAAEAYADAIREGRNQDEATTEANNVLYDGLRFSKYDTIMDVLTEEFTEELSEEEFRPFGIQLLPHCEKVFERYELNDDFAYSSEYDALYTEITGAIQLYIEENGIHVQMENA